jgi:hypothetical protein
VPSASLMWTASCPTCSAVTCLACFPLQRASTPPAQAPAGTGARCSPPWRFRTRRTRSAANFDRVRRRLSSGCAQLLVVGSIWFESSARLLVASSSIVTGATCPFSAVVMFVVDAFCTSCFVGSRDLPCSCLPDARRCCRSALQAQVPFVCRPSAPRSHFCARQHQHSRAPRHLGRPIKRYPRTLNNITSARSLPVTRGSVLVSANRELSVTLVQSQGCVYRPCAMLLAKASGPLVLPGANAPLND